MKNLTLLDRFSKNTEMSDSIKIRRVGAEFLHMGQTDRDEANSPFSQYGARA